MLLLSTAGPLFDFAPSTDAPLFDSMLDGREVLLSSDLSLTAEGTWHDGGQCLHPQTPPGLLLVNKAN
jgi:hypothetical protein